MKDGDFPYVSLPEGISHPKKLHTKSFIDQLKKTWGIRIRKNPQIKNIQNR